MSRRPALVLFDFDGVLVHYDHAARLRVLAECSGASVTEVSAALFGSGLETALPISAATMRRGKWTNW